MKKLAVVLLIFCFSSVVIGKEAVYIPKPKYCFDIYVDLNGVPFVVEKPCPVY